MKMNNYNNLTEDFAVDFELLRLEKLIEEREAYEEQFFSLKPPVDEFEHTISQHNYELQEYELNYAFPSLEEIPVNSFEIEDYLNQLRDEKLIEEREIYEENFLSILIDDSAIDEFYKFQMDTMGLEEFLNIDDFYDYDYKYEPDYEYDQYEEDMFWEIEYLKRSQFESPKCGCAYLDYMPHDDGLCDYLDCYDYPEGPDENLNGIKYY